MKNRYDSKGTYAQPQATTFISLKAYQDHLVEKHLYLVDQLAKSFMNKFESNNRLCEGDMHSVGYEALVLATRTYDLNEGKPFVSYARTVIDNAMKGELLDLFPVDLKSSWDKNDFHYSETFDSRVFEDATADKHSNWLCNWEEERQNLLDSLSEAFKRLTPQELSLIEARFGFNGQEMKLVDLGNQLHISHQAVDKRLHNILNKLFALLNTGRTPYRKCA